MCSKNIVMLARTLSKLLTCSWLFATLAYAGLESTRNNVESDSRLPYFKVSGSYYDVGYKVVSCVWLGKNYNFCNFKIRDVK